MRQLQPQSQPGRPRPARREAERIGSTITDPCGALSGERIRPGHALQSELPVCCRLRNERRATPERVEGEHQVQRQPSRAANW